MGKTELRVEIDAVLLAEAEAIGVALDAALEAGVRQAINREKAEQLDLAERGRRQSTDPVGSHARAKAWTEENAEAIAEHNERIARRGLIGDEWRKW